MKPHQSVSILVLLLGLLTSETAVAATVFHLSTLHSVYPQADGSFVIRLDADSSACTSIETPKYYVVAVGQNGMTAEGSAKIYAAVLLALAGGKSVRVHFEDSSPNCYVNRISVLD